MANFEQKEIDVSKINNGQRYKNGDVVDAEAINAPIEASLFAQATANEAKQIAEEVRDNITTYIDAAILGGEW